MVGLGEATHGSREFFLAKHRLLEFLCGELGFTTLAMEASVSAAAAVDDYVQGGPGDPAEALAGLGFWTWRTAEMLDVIDWMREHNRTAAWKVRFAGIDPQFPAASLDALRAYLSGLAASPNGSAASSDGSAASSDGGALALLDPLVPLATARLAPGRRLDREVEAAARRLEEFLATRDPDGGTALHAARAHARIVRQFADLAGRPFTDADPERTVGFARDRYLADNVDLLLADPDAKVAVWAHNGHIMRGGRCGVPVMGSHLAERHGKAYYALGLLFGRGAFRARRRGFGGRVNTDQPPVTFRVLAIRNAAMVESRLAAAHPGTYAVDLRSGPRPDAVTGWLRGDGRLRSFGAMAGRLTAAFASMPVVLGDQFDGLVYVRRTTASTPL
ncbi:MAG TPA: erythromycin esterase family protein [Nonomuraea sp.]|nr:erythromycin esterase family protein [Nonomuraea sp.]